MAQNLNLLPNEPGLKDLLDYFGKQLKLEINCHHIGTIKSFDSANQTAQITINYTKTFQQLTSNGNVNVITSNYPLLAECPVICLGGGAGSLTFPISEGDECLVLFNDRDLDNWFNGSSSSAPNTPRLHSFADAVALVGLRSLAKVLTSYPTNAVSLNYGVNNVQILSDKIVINIGATTKLEIDSSGILKITNPSGELLAALNNLFQAIQAGTAGGFPLVFPPTFATNLAILGTFV